MTKTKASTTRPPSTFVVGREVLAEDAQDAVEMLHYAFADNPSMHFSFAAGGQHWGASGNEIPAQGIVFEDTGTAWIEHYEGDIWIDPDTPSVTLGAECFFNASNTGDVRFTVGTQTATLSFANSDNGSEKTTTISRSAMTLVDGWAEVKIEIRRQTGAATDNEVLRLRCQDSRITTLPDPPNE